MYECKIFIICYFFHLQNIHMSQFGWDDTVSHKPQCNYLYTTEMVQWSHSYAKIVAWRDMHGYGSFVMNVRPKGPN